jgi:hypothetical protein
VLTEYNLWSCVSRVANTYTNWGFRWNAQRSIGTYLVFVCKYFNTLAVCHVSLNVYFLDMHLVHMMMRTRARKGIPNSLT